VVLLHADPTRTTIDTAYLSDRLRLNIASVPDAVFEKLDGDPDTDVVIVDTRTTEPVACERILRRIADRNIATVLVTDADPSPEILSLSTDAHLSSPDDPAAIVRSVERLRERDAADGNNDSARDAARAAGGSSVSLDPLYHRDSAVFYGLWFLAAATYGFGDIVSTLLAVVTAPGIVESNPIVAGVLANYGIPGFLAVKLAILVVLVWISVGGARDDDRFTYYWPPVVATVLGTGLTGWNLWLLYGPG
jgi:hypothetical protein